MFRRIFAAAAAGACAVAHFVKEKAMLIVGASTAAFYTASASAQSTVTPVDTSALTTGLTTVTGIFNTVAGIVAAAVLFFIGVKVFKWIRK